MEDSSWLNTVAIWNLISNTRFDVETSFCLRSSDRNVVLTEDVAAAAEGIKNEFKDLVDKIINHEGRLDVISIMNGNQEGYTEEHQCQMGTWADRPEFLDGPFIWKQNFLETCLVCGKFTCNQRATIYTCKHCFRPLQVPGSSSSCDTTCAKTPCTSSMNMSFVWEFCMTLREAFQAWLDFHKFGKNRKIPFFEYIPAETCGILTKTVGKVWREKLEPYYDEDTKWRSPSHFIHTEKQWALWLISSPPGCSFRNYMPIFTACYHKAQENPKKHAAGVPHQSARKKQKTWNAP